MYVFRDLKKTHRRLPKGSTAQLNSKRKMEEIEQKNITIPPPLPKKIKVEEGEDFISLYENYKRDGKVTKEIDLQLLKLLKKNCKKSVV